MTYETIELAIRDSIATIMLNRPDRLNAYTVGMGAEIADALGRCDEDDDVRAVILTGAGRAFCAGLDMAGGEETFSRLDLEPRADGPRRGPIDVRKPVIAAINGHAVGVGLTLAMQCDVRLVADDAKLGFVFVSRGIIPEANASWILPRVVGLSVACDLLLTGRTFSGREAAELGVASRALPAADVLPAGRALAEAVRDGAAPVSVAITKRLLWESLEVSRTESLEAETQLLRWAGGQPDAAEGARSFLEKRSPRWVLRPSRDLPDWPLRPGAAC